MAPQIHETAIVDAGASIGESTKIWHWAHICATASIGPGCSLGQNVFVADHVAIGARVKVQNNVSVYEGVTLEDDVFCGPSVVFTNVINPRSHVPRKHEYKPTLVKTGASLGANVTVVCGNTVGCFAMVGAGAVVTRDVKDYALMIGVPAHRIGWVCHCGERLPVDSSEDARGIACPECATTFQVAGGHCEPDTP